MGTGPSWVPRPWRRIAVPGLHGHELEDLHREPALALGQEGVVLGVLLGRGQAVGLDDRVAGLVAWRWAGAVVADRRPGPERRSRVGKRRPVLLHPGAPGGHLLG